MSCELNAVIRKADRLERKLVKKIRQDIILFLYCRKS